MDLEADQYIGFFQAWNDTGRSNYSGTIGPGSKDKLLQHLEFYRDGHPFVARLEVKLVPLGPLEDVIPLNVDTSPERRATWDARRDELYKLRY